MSELVSYPTRWSLLFVFGFLWWSSIYISASQQQRNMVQQCTKTEEEEEQGDRDRSWSVSSLPRGDSCVPPRRHGASKPSAASPFQVPPTVFGLSPQLLLYRDKYESIIWKGYKMLKMSELWNLLWKLCAYKSETSISPWFYSCVSIVS